jgi:hypothetical protein
MHKNRHLIPYDPFAARCLGCNNQGNPDLKHPVCGNVYVGGHVDSVFLFSY